MGRKNKSDINNNIIKSQPSELGGATKLEINGEELIESGSTMMTHGGKLWDALFILIKNNDKDFIYDFVNRIPCETCKKDFIIMINKKDFENKTRDELYILLWECRQAIHGKYKKKTLAEYLKYLYIV